MNEKYFRSSKKYQQKIERMATHSNEKQPLSKPALLEKEEIQMILQYWIRMSSIKLGWINDFDRLIVNYVMFFVTSAFILLETFCSLSKLVKTFTGHINTVWSIDYITFDNDQLICSGSNDKTVRVWDVDKNKQIQSFNGHLSPVYFIVMLFCSSSFDKTIRFWDIKHNQQLQIFNQCKDAVYGIEFSPFNGGRYLCSGSYDKTIRLWDVDTLNSLQVFNGHKYGVWCVAFSPLQSNNNNGNNTGVIGGNGYTICSGSDDKTIRLWDIETTKQLIMFNGHDNLIRSVKYGSNELGMIGGANTILSGSYDQKCPFVGYSICKAIGSNVICSGSNDNTIRFWDIRSNDRELHIIKGNEEDKGIYYFKLIPLKIKRKNNEQKLNDCDIGLCYGSDKGSIRIWG
ncbi:WD-40 repeat protein [Reticulomyxa filosa]|uniref:WD-40 repeat protein n=1 Tax=Reticulomyxa filosa TaxID=46433 RepID=X6LTC7_RETFI|nr:WD-40 repeat protein [Reticulomyxa filosa]|eukprot:ETO04357.1 WD-40 repeat protein [Reticulomyxa filosa]